MATAWSSGGASPPGGGASASMPDPRCRASSRTPCALRSRLAPNCTAAPSASAALVVSTTKSAPMSWEEMNMRCAANRVPDEVATSAMPAIATAWVRTERRRIGRRSMAPSAIDKTAPAAAEPSRTMASCAGACAASTATVASTNPLTNTPISAA